MPRNTRELSVQATEGGIITGRKALILSAVALTIVSFGIGYGVNDLTRPDSAEIQNVEAESGQPSQDQTIYRDTTSSLGGETDEALEQIASVQAELIQARADLRISDETISTMKSKESDDGADTPEERYALYQELANDPAVKRMRAADMRYGIEDPELEKVRRAQRVMRLAQNYAYLLKKLDYTDEQSEALVKLLLDNELAAEASRKEWRQADFKSEITVEERRLRRKNLQDEQDVTVADLLGSDFQEYRDYRDTLQERQSLNFYASSFGEPLDDYTKEALIRVMYEEQKAVVWPPPPSRDLESLVEHSRKMLAARKTKADRVMERATSYLTEQQLKDLRKSLEIERKRHEMGLKMEEIRLRDQKGRPGP